MKKFMEAIEDVTKFIGSLEHKRNTLYPWHASEILDLRPLKKKKRKYTRKKK